jgi:hypothetical protein
MIPITRKSRSLRAKQGLALLSAGLILNVQAAAQCFSDTFEPNDTCATAAVLSASANAQSFSAVMSGADSTEGVNRDFYRVTVPAGETLIATLDFFELDVARLWVWSDVQCTQLVGMGMGNPGTPVITENTSGAPKDYWLEIGPTPGGPTIQCLNYSVRVQSYLDLCPGLLSDSFEPNNDEASAQLLLPGLHTLNLATPGNLQDYFLIPTSPGDLITIAVTPTFNSPITNPNYQAVYDPAHQVILQGFENDGTISVINTTGSNLVGLRVGLSASVPSCSEYTIDLAVTSAPCSGLLPDPFEPNDSCGNRVPITAGDYLGMNAMHQNGDFYQLDLAPGESMVLDVRYPEPDPISGLYLAVYEECDTGSYYVTTTTPGRKTCVARNDTSGVLSLTIVAGVGDITPNAPCVLYDMHVGVYPDASMGPNYCDALPNSTGATGKFHALGSSVVADNEFTVLVDDLPLAVPVLLFYGPNQVALPFGNGIRCVGGQTRRLPPVVSTYGLFGFITKEIDLTTSPAVLDMVPGSTWNFQAWHRDNGSFNLSDAVSITFQ